MVNLIYGFHSINSYIKHNANNILKIYIDEKRQDKRQLALMELIEKYNLAFELVKNTKLDSLSKTKTHQGVVAQITALDTSQTLEQLLKQITNKPSALIMILDGITDPHNLGAIIRTSDCFAVDAVIIPKDNAANKDNPTVAKVSSGAINNLPVITVNNLSRTIEILKDHEFWVAGTTLAEDSISLFDFKPSGRLVWVLGNEATGIRRLVSENCDYLITIPMFGQTQSLNVSVSAGVVLSYTRYLQQQ